MQNFVAPELVSIDDIAEGVYAGSGAASQDPQATPIPIPTVTATPAPTETPGEGDDSEYENPNCWVNWQCRWTGHNNGGHSVCHVSANHCGNHSGSNLVMNFVTTFPILEIKSTSGLTVSNVGTYNFTLIRNNFFNPGDSIGFTFEIVTSALMYDENGNPLHGAIGANNADAHYCKVVSYTCS